MNLKSSTLFLLILFLGLTQCLFGQKDAKQLAKFMMGSYNNMEQAVADSQFLKIQLTISKVNSIKKEGSVFLYVEQALMKHADNPYRQRIYEVRSAGPQKLVSEVYLLKSPGLYISNLKAVETLTLDSLIKKGECSVELQKINKNLYRGGTQDKECVSELKGARYATSEVEILPAEMKTLDRGFDANDKQVWGSTHGPYIFNKIGKH